jgi:hypothetical protein
VIIKNSFINQEKSSKCGEIMRETLFPSFPVIARYSKQFSHNHAYLFLRIKEMLPKEYGKSKGIDKKIKEVSFIYF